MSYSRSYSERIAVRYSGTVSYNYPASQNGGSGTAHYSGTTYEDVNVNIDVDTNPFDESVEGCNNNVNILTGTVVATESAQIVSIDKNAKKIGTTIIEGFFKTIRFEISQQIVELSKRIDAQIMHLRELAKSCSAKQKQMETDYNRLSSRYLKIFEDLNNELSNRIFELDKPAFLFKKDCDNHANRSSNNDLVSTVTVCGTEESALQARIYASVAKKRAMDTISQVKIFLWKQKNLEISIDQCMLNENVSAKRYAPVCYLETLGNNSQINRNVYQPDFFSRMNDNKLIEDFDNQNWLNASTEKKDNIQRYFNLEVNTAFISDNLHNNRVKSMMMRIFDMNYLKSI